MNDTIRSTPLTCERSTTKSLAATTTMSTAPVIQIARRPVRVASTINVSASTDQKIESAACTTTERIIGSNAYGIVDQWWMLRSRIPFSHRNASAEAAAAAGGAPIAAGNSPGLRRNPSHAKTPPRIASTCPRSSAFTNGMYGSGSLRPSCVTFAYTTQTASAPRIAPKAALRYERGYAETGQRSSIEALAITIATIAGTTITAAIDHAVPRAVYSTASQWSSTAPSTATTSAVPAWSTES